MWAMYFFEQAWGRFYQRREKEGQVNRYTRNGQVKAIYKSTGCASRASLYASDFGVLLLVSNRVYMFPCLPVCMFTCPTYD